MEYPHPFIEFAHYSQDVEPNPPATCANLRHKFVCMNHSLVINAQVTASDIMNVRYAFIYHPKENDVQIVPANDELAPNYIKCGCFKVLSYIVSREKKIVEQIRKKDDSGINKWFMLMSVFNNKLIQTVEDFEASK